MHFYTFLTNAIILSGGAFAARNGQTQTNGIGVRANITSNETVEAVPRQLPKNDAPALNRNGNGNGKRLLLDLQNVSGFQKRSKKSGSPGPQDPPPKSTTANAKCFQSDTYGDCSFPGGHLPCDKDLPCKGVMHKCTPILALGIAYCT